MTWNADPSPRLTEADYKVLAGFRYELRRFLAFSKREAEGAGLKPQQYQALLALKAKGPSEPMAAKELADELFIRLSTAVELIDRLQDQNLVARTASPDDGRRMLVSLTPEAETVLQNLAAVHMAELKAHVPQLIDLLGRIACPKPPA